MSTTTLIATETETAHADDMDILVPAAGNTMPSARAGIRKMLQERERHTEGTELIMAPAFLITGGVNPEEELLKMFWKYPKNSEERAHTAVRYLRALAASLIAADIEPGSPASDIWWTDVPDEILDAACGLDMWMDTWNCDWDEFPAERVLDAVKRDIFVLSDSNVLEFAATRSLEAAEALHDWIHALADTANAWLDPGPYALEMSAQG